MNTDELTKLRAEAEEAHEAARDSAVAEIQRRMDRRMAVL